MERLKPAHKTHSNPDDDRRVIHLVQSEERHIHSLSFTLTKDPMTSALIRMMKYHNMLTAIHTASCEICHAAISRQHAHMHTHSHSDSSHTASRCQRQTECGCSFKGATETTSSFSQPLLAIHAYIHTYTHTYTHTARQITMV